MAVWPARIDWASESVEGEVKFPAPPTLPWFGVDPPPVLCRLTFEREAFAAKADESVLDDRVRESVRSGRWRGNVEVELFECR